MELNSRQRVALEYLIDNPLTTTEQALRNLRDGGYGDLTPEDIDSMRSFAAEERGKRVIQGVRNYLEGNKGRERIEDVKRGIQGYVKHPQNSEVEKALALIQKG
jgi:hypothetical protein